MAHYVLTPSTTHKDFEDRPISESTYSSGPFPVDTPPETFAPAHLRRQPSDPSDPHYLATKELPPLPADRESANFFATPRQPHPEPGRSSSSSDDFNDKSFEVEKSARHPSRKKSKKDEKKKDEDEKKGFDPLDRLPENERAILKRQIEAQETKVTFFTLFRYATRNDLLILFISAACATAAGAVLPLMTIIFGSLASSFQDYFNGTVNGDQFTHTLNHTTLYYVYLAIGEFVTVYVSTVGFIYVGEHVTQKIREQYLAAILRQNVGFFDKLGAGEITTRITADMNAVQDGISEKIGLTLTAVATFVTAFIIGYIQYWLLALILSSTVVAITVIMGSGGGSIKKWTQSAIESYALGGTVAEEVLSSIRNAVAFGTQDKLASQYDAYLEAAMYWGKRHKSLLGLMLGGMMCVINLNYGLAFWQGSKFLVSGQGGVTLQNILTTLLAIMIGAFSLGNVAPNIQAFHGAIAAGKKVFVTIDRKSPIDPSDPAGKRLAHVEGSLALRNVKHIYPSRPEVVVMEDCSLDIPAGKTTALVGSSGSGKSTIVGLALRLYDPVGGAVFLDHTNVQDLNVKFLRQQISLVSQEPTLFSTTIFNNIAHGLIGTEYERDDSVKKVIRVTEAARMANAHTFIEELPEGYETNVGERGFLLSGGQKQRIAIARAIVSDPKILLLDEATSALDTKSEGIVQAALDKASIGRTTIVVAHRLSTIRHADNIVVMGLGRIVEQGTHDQLLEQGGTYATLVEAQQINAAKQKERENSAWSDDSDDEEVDAGFTKIKTTQSRRSQLRATRTQSMASISPSAMEARQSKKDQDYGLWTLIKTIASMNKQEWHLMLIGLGASIVSGGGQPVQSIFFAKSIVAMSRPPTQYAELRSDINYWCWMYLMLGLVMLLSFSTSGVAFALCSEKMVYRARDRAFRSMLRQDISFYDKDENTAGALTTFLSTETTNVAGLSGVTLGTILNVTTTLIAAFTVSIAIGWKLALVTISTVPILLGCGFFRFYVLNKFAARSKKSYEKSASYACEATSAIRTVASLTREQDVWNVYHSQLEAQGKRSLKSVSRSSILYASSQSLMFCCMALGFWYGGKLIASGEYDLFQFFLCFSAVIFGAQSAGTIFSFAPDMSKARNAAVALKRLFDRQPLIDTWSQEGAAVPHVQGQIEFRDVHFRYPTRPAVRVLRGVDLTVKPGEYVALVGASGCGKSTSIGLIERFYDPHSGAVLLDGQNVAELNINQYRKHIALVSQEPTLYQGTIKDNILLGSAIDPSQVSDRDIERACRNANIWTFVSSLPDGLSTQLGNKGVMLSGGQKQRIAIARALIRNPKVLLLDEATSALDSESEKIVQAALDEAAKGRTTIAVAHRLSTIQRADRIYVFEGGRIVESGKHQQLLARKGRYFELVQMQSLARNG
ncbi:MAG: hypothetical protein Q9162_003727 [Coniocarpon cinnabarinum]